MVPSQMPIPLHHACLSTARLRSPPQKPTSVTTCAPYQRRVGLVWLTVGVPSSVTLLPLPHPSLSLPHSSSFLPSLSPPPSANTSIQLSSDQQAKLSTLDSFNSFLKGGVAPMLPLAAEIAISTSASYGWIGRNTSVRRY